MESVSLKKVLLVVTTVFVLAPAIAYASHRFTDVPTGHTFTTTSRGSPIRA